MTSGPDGIEVIDPKRPARFVALCDPDRGVTTEAGQYRPGYDWERLRIPRLNDQELAAWLRPDGDCFAFDLIR